MKEDLIDKRARQKKIAIILLIVSIFVEVIACILWLIPVAGFMIYPFVSGAAVVLNVISFILAKDSKFVRVIDGVIAAMLIVIIVADIIFLIRLMFGML